MISMSSGAANASSNIALASASVICSDSPGLSWVWKLNWSWPLTLAMKARRSRFTAQYIQARGCGMTS